MENKNFAQKLETMPEHTEPAPPPTEMAPRNIDQHPCFNVAAKATCGRVHLPVAPKCNILCRYCDRKHDCVNESRPGVTSVVLTPSQALEYLVEVKKHRPDITVVGIAGPGDPMATADTTIETIKLVRGEFPEMLFCLSTNGLALGEHIDELASLGVTHLTVTINAVDPEVGAKVYAWARDGKRVHRGGEAAKLLISRQLEAVARLKALGIVVKVNSIIIPGVNDNHIAEIAKTVAGLGADIINCLPLRPTADTDFADTPEPDEALVAKVRAEAGVHLPIMAHCGRCRADAVGKLDEAHDEDKLATLRYFGRDKPLVGGERPYVAVATREGIFVNRHLGEASSLRVFGKNGDGYKFVGNRETPSVGGGDERWRTLARTLHDCAAILVNGVGERPLRLLANEGVKVVEMSGVIEDGLDHVYLGKPLRAPKCRADFKCGATCSGGGGGCG